MGLIINATEEKKITIQGTEIELPSVYARLEFAGRADGFRLEIAVAIYASKTAYIGGAGQLSTNVPQGTLNAELQESEVQSVETAHQYAKSAFEQEGFTATVDL